MGLGKVYGYARVSSKDQCIDRQLDSFSDFGVERKLIYCDRASGKDFQRPAYKQLMKKLREGDTLVLKSIDRLGRNYNEILLEWKTITKEKGVSVVVLDMPLLNTREQKEGITSIFISDLLLQLLSYISQIERENIKQRQAEGIASAKARGVQFGRPKIPRPDCYSEIKFLYKNGIINRKEAAKRLHVCIATFDRWIKSDEEEKKCWTNVSNSVSNW